MKNIFLLSTIINSANVGSNGMSDDLKGAIITALVTGLISIIGFVVTNTSMKRNFKNELKRQRDSIVLEKMSTMPYEVLALMDELIESDRIQNETIKKRDREQNLKHFKEIMNTIYSYGSEAAIKIISLIQKENYASSQNSNCADKYRMITSYVLLATQIKYDVTEISVSPELWFQMRMTDYLIYKDDFKNANNKLIDELKLKTEFKIK